jgi:pimeloyl-ACP methyl ester carboxylesterase
MKKYITQTVFTLIFSCTSFQLIAYEFRSQDFSFLFVDGMFSEFNDSNYQGIISAIDAADEATDISVWRPSSFTTLEVNAEKLLSVESFANPKKELILVGHSRGAAEILLALLQSEDAVLDNIAQAVLFQGAYYGSPLAEGSVRKFEKWCESRLGFKMKGLCDDSTSFLVGIRGLNPKYVTGVFAKAIQEASEERKDLLKEKVSFVRASTSFKNASYPFKALYLYNKRKTGEANDGILTTSEQMIEGLGYDFGVYESDHIGLTGEKSKRVPPPSDFFAYVLKRLWANERIAP